MASNDGGDGTSNPPPSGLQFVNMTPTTQAERQRNRKVIRSAAMKTFRRNQKLERVREKEGKPLASKIELEEQELSYRPKHTSESEPSLPENHWEGSVVSPTKLVGGTGADAGVAFTTPDMNWASWSQSMCPSSVISSHFDCLSLDASLLLCS